MSTRGRLPVVKSVLIIQFSHGKSIAFNYKSNKRNELLNTNRQSQWLKYYFSVIAVKLTLMSEEKLRFQT